VRDIREILTGKCGAVLKGYPQSPSMKRAMERERVIIHVMGFSHGNQPSSDKGVTLFNFVTSIFDVGKYGDIRGIYEISKTCRHITYMKNMLQ